MAGKPLLIKQIACTSDTVYALTDDGFGGEIYRMNVDNTGQVTWEAIDGPTEDDEQGSE